MTDGKAEAENIVYQGRIKVPYKWSVGEIGSHFLTRLRDAREIWGRQCPRCGKVYVPPVKNCGECFTLTDQWIQVRDTGTVESFTVVRYSHDVQPVKAPLAYGLIRLDGADGALLHLIGGIDFDRLKVGMRVKAVFADQREGSVLDIRHFEPI